MKLSVIIPMYNEKAIAAGCAASLTKRLEADAMAESYEYEIIFSDDGSSDGCGDAVREFAASQALEFGEVRVITSPENEGKGGAVRRGMLAAEGEFVLFTDCDLAYGAESVVDMFRAESEVYEKDSSSAVMIGSRAVHKDGYSGYTFMRRLASKAFILLLSRSAGFSHSDSQSGIKIFRREAAREIFSLCTVNGWAFDFEVLMIAEKLGYSIREFPVRVINHRESKIHLVSDTLKMVSDVRKIKKRVDGLDFGK